MVLRIHVMAGALAASVSTGALAQAAKPAAPSVAPQSPAQTKTTTTQSTSTTNPVPDENGDPVAVQQTTDTSQSTTTQPAAPGTPAQSATTQTTTTAPDATGAPATTTTTTTTEPATDQTGATVTAATAADVKANVPVFDQKGGVVGKIASVSASGAIVTTGKARVEIPVASFGKNDKGLVMSMTKAEIEAASADQTKKTAAPKKK